jgi:tetratricopeptide (TPR) repeat protein
LVFVFFINCGTKEYKLSGDLFIKSEEYEKAAAQFKKWVNRDPNNAKAFVSLSVPFYKEGDYKKSAEYLGKAFDINRDSASEAVGYYENLMKVENYSWNVFYNGSKSYIDEQQFKIADSLIEKAEEVTSIPRYKAAAYALHGRISIMGKNEDKSLECLNKALDLDSNNVDAHIYLGEIYTGQNNTEKAIFHLKKAVLINPQYFMGYKLLGLNYLKVKKYDMAIEMLEKASSNISNDPVILYDLAFAYLQKEDYTRAKNIAEKILGLTELESKIKAEAYITLGMSDIYNENYNEAIDALKNAIAADSGNCDSYQLLAHAYNKLGKANLSREFTKKWEQCVTK